MFKNKSTSPKQAEQSDKKDARTPATLPLVIKLDHPFNLGERVISTITCERRPTVRTMKRLAACGDDDAEMIEIMFEEMFDMSPRESDLVDMEDGIRALETVTDFFPKLKGDDQT